MAAPREVIQIASDSDEDDDLRRAIALSIQDQHEKEASGPGCSSKREPASEPNPAPSPKDRTVQFGSLNLDRKAMEEERLRRARKRLRSSDGDAEAQARPAKRPTRSSSPTKGGGKMRETGTGKTAAGGGLQFPHPTVKRTWARGHDRRGDDITVEEVLQKDKLKLAMISSFQWDEEWMLSKIDFKNTKVLMVAFAKNEDQKKAIAANSPAGVRVCFPPMYGFGSMHSKLQILKFEGYIRLVIPTANFVPYDWGETGTMENMVFLIDLPELEHGIEREMTAFQRELQCYLEAMGVDPPMISSLSKYDFSRTKNVGFVHSIPGSHQAESMSRVGYRGLGACVAALGLASSAPIEVDLACASLGALSHDFIKAFYDACRGGASAPHQFIDVAPPAEIARGNVPAAAGKGTGTASKAAETAHTSPRSGKPPRLMGARTEVAMAQMRERFRIYFPTDRTVAGSRGGRQAGGTLCMQAKSWQSAGFPAELLRDVVTTRDRILMHTKVVFVRRPCSGEDGSRQSPGWAYVGSANLSESAWGRLSTTKGQTKLICRNWECGVLIPLPKGDGQPRALAHDLSMFAGIIPIPMQVPGPVYRPGDEPWFFMGTGMGAR